MIKKILIILALLLIFALNGCKETTTQPCGTDDITITIIAQYDDCNGNWLTAEEAFVTITQNSGTNVVILDSGETVKGKYNYTPINSGCGIGNLSITANYLGRIQVLNVGYICKDTIVEVCVPCDTVPPQTCNSPGQIDPLIFIDDLSGNQCIPVNSPSKNSFYTRQAKYTNGSGNNIVIKNLASVLNYNQNFQNGKFRFKQPANFTVSGSDVILAPGESVTLIFELLTDEIGTFKEKLTFPVNCQGNSLTEQWEINLLAEVCPTPCDCPYSTDKEPYYAGLKDAESLQQGETKTYNNVKVLEIASTALQQGCYMVINDIVRIDDKGAEYSTFGGSNNPYQLNPGNAIYGFDDWMIVTPVSNTNQIKAGGSLSLNVKVGPVSRSGFLRDTFKLITTIYDKNGAVKDPNCEYKFYLQGKTCEDVCAVLEIMDLNAEQGSKKIEVKEINTQNVPNIWDANLFASAQTPINPINMGNYFNNNQIFVKFFSDFEPDAACTELDGNTTEFEFKVMIDKNILFCNKHQYNLSAINTGESDSEIDRKYFSFSPNSSTLSKYGEYFPVNVEFKPPTASELELMWNNGSKPNGDSTFKFRVQIWNQSINCHIVLNFEAKINGLPAISPERTLTAFNRITRLSSTPFYNSVRIKEKNIHYYANVSNLRLQETRFPANDPPHNSPNTNHNFYFNVDNPRNPSIVGELPELYLVQTNSNIFNRITTVPIAKYNSYDDFAADLGNLVNAVFTGSFNSRGTAPNRNFSYNSTSLIWSNSADKNEFNLGGTLGHPNGLVLDAGEIYLIWSTSGGSYLYNGNRFPCELAFIFINEIHDGTIPNVDERAKITINVVYPINK